MLQFLSLLSVLRYQMLWSFNFAYNPLAPQLVMLLTLAASICLACCKRIPSLPSDAPVVLLSRELDAIHCSSITSYGANLPSFCCSTVNIASVFCLAHLRCLPSNAPTKTQGVY